MKDWKTVFNTRNYHYIFIKSLRDEQYLDFFYTYQKEIEENPTFFMLMPSPEEIKNEDNKDYMKKYAPLLKTFMESSKTTLFTEEDILKAIIKEDKRANFFRFLSKNNKNIVLFTYGDFDSYANKQDFLSIKMTREDLHRQHSLFDRFGDIKNAIKKTYNPFRNPQEAFEKMHEN